MDHSRWTTIWLCCLMMGAALQACPSSSDPGEDSAEGADAAGDAGTGDGDDSDGDDSDAADTGGSGGAPTLGVRDGHADDGTGDGDGDGDSAAAGAGAGDGDGDGDASPSGDGDTSGDGDGDASGDGDGDAADIPDNYCELGMAGGTLGTDFVSFSVDPTIPMIGSGQADLLIDLALLVYMADAPDVEVVVVDDASGAKTEWTSNGDTDFACAGDGWCERIGVLLDTYPLWEAEDDPLHLMLLPVTVTLTVSDELGPFCRTSISAPLKRVDQ